MEGVALEGGGCVRVERNFVAVELPGDLPEDKTDNRILKVCRGLADSRPEQVVLVTKDILLRIKAQIIGIRAEDFAAEQVFEQDGQYTGRCQVFAPEEMFRELKKKGNPSGGSLSDR